MSEPSNGEERTDQGMMQNINDTAENVSDGITNTAENISDGINQGLNVAKENIDQAVTNFSSNENVQATTSFLEANTLIAKFSFLILVVVGFFVLFNLGIQVIGYFMSTSQNPILVNGKIEAQSGGLTISQNPQVKDSIVIPRSNNALTGIEFTWSVWLLYNPPPNTTNTSPIYEPVFIKGDCSIGDNSTFCSLNNAPGVYLGPATLVDKDNNNNPIPNSLWILMDTIPTPSKDSVDANNNTEYIEITQVPINKFFHVAIRCQNKYIDVYVNGTIVFRKNLVNVPKQNYYDLQVCPTPAYPGSLSDLKYYSRALTVVDINSIVLKGPNMNSAKAGSSQSVGTNYLSTLWYGKFLH